MDFKDLAANEASSLVAGLLARRSEATLRDLHTLRDALDGVLRSAELTAPPVAEDHEEIASFVDHLASVVAADADRQAAAAAEAGRRAVEHTEQEGTARLEAERIKSAKAIEAARAKSGAMIEAMRAESTAVIEAVRAESTAAIATARSERLAAVEAAQTEGAAAIETARTDGKRAIHEAQLEAAASVEAARADAASTITAIRTESAAALAAERAALAAETEQTVADALAQVAALEAEFKAQAETAHAQLEERAKALSAAETALREARDSSHASTAETKELKRELRELRSGWDAARTEMDAARLALDTARAEVEALRGELGRAEQTIKALEGRQAPASAGSSGAHSAESLAHLLSVFDRVDKGSTFDEVLGALAEALRAGFPRVAVFTLASNKLHSTHQIGFEAELGNAVSPVTANPSFAHALGVNHAEAPSGAPGTDALRKQFGGAPERALLVPIKIHGESLAVVYADTEDRDTASPGASVEFAELLRRHVVPRLEQARADLKVIAELRAYALLLIDEVEYMHAADVSAGKSDAEIRKGLDTNVQCARQMFSQRAANEGPVASRLLEEQLAEVIGEKRSSRFGKDLAKLEATAAKR